MGDEGQEVIASAGEEIELECIVSGGNPPAKLKWFAGEQELQSGHTQEDTRPSPSSRTWMSVSRLTLPVSEDDNGATIRCSADHPTMETPMATKRQLTIHCKRNQTITVSIYSTTDRTKYSCMQQQLLILSN